MESISGGSDGAGLHVAIVASRFNDVVVNQLFDGARDHLLSSGVADGDITVVWVPGAFELPLAAKVLAERGDVDAIVCLGAVIRGDTAHFEYVSDAACSGIAEVGLSTGIPVSLGVLTVDTLVQALERCGGEHGNKGAEAAAVAIEMADLLRQVSRAQPVRPA
jgi:6,7-dimethyl-8-ribityllumazine synthase